MRILVVVSSIGMGGISRMVADTVRHMRAQGYEVRVVSLTAVGAKEAPDWLSDATVFNLMSLRRAGMLKAVSMLAKELITYKPDVVHSHAVHATLALRAACLITGRARKLVSTKHAVREGKGILEIAEHFSFFLSRSNTAVSAAVADSGAGWRVWRIIPNGIDVQFFSRDSYDGSEKDRSPDEFRILVVGRLSQNKDQATVVRAVRYALDAGTNCSLTLVGDGAERQNLMRLVADLGMNSNVNFAGSIDDVRPLLYEADCFILPSRMEGLGLALAEAMAMEIPCIATDVGGIPEVGGGFTALVPPGDSKRMGEVISTTASEPSDAGALRAARSHIEQYYSMTSMVEGYEKLYREIHSGLRNGVSLDSV